MMSNTETVRVLAISGSLRTASSNSALVSAAVRLAPEGTEVSIYSELAEVPPFNPDLDVDPALVLMAGSYTAYRTRGNRADASQIACMLRELRQNHDFG